MPAKAPPISTALEQVLRDLGQELRAQRKRLKVSATLAAEAAQMSRVTLHRIERGEPSVAMGAYLSVISSLGLNLDLRDARRQKQRSQNSIAKLPSKIRLADYPQLRRLAWQLKGTQELTPKEALDLYERNWRHMDLNSLEPHELELLNLLRTTFGMERLLV